MPPIDKATDAKLLSCAFFYPDLWYAQILELHPDICGANSPASVKNRLEYFKHGLKGSLSPRLYTLLASYHLQFGFFELGIGFIPLGAPQANGQHDGTAEANNQDDDGEPHPDNQNDVATIDNAGPGENNQADLVFDENFVMVADGIDFPVFAPPPGENNAGNDDGANDYGSNLTDGSDDSSFVDVN
jgi:hypothetical protein